MVEHQVGRNYSHTTGDDHLKILHKIKSGKINEIPLDTYKTITRHRQKEGKVSHEGWAVKAVHEEKEHEYVWLFSPEEARRLHEDLGKMLDRLTDDELSFIQEEEHEE